MKIIAFYLPQFHRTAENDEWWGEGFTEWINVMKAKKIYKNQKQPHIPLNNNYYDLMDKSTVEWQTNLMNKYGIYGFCYFHYWFKGRKILEKPAENLLKWKDINQPFCFAWANVTWARTWSVYDEFTTDWISTDRKVDGNGILIEQEYGNEQHWVEHYNYLKNFFADKRYIKVNNMPLFLIYHIEYIPEMKKMFSLWNELARQDGFRGLHIVSMNMPTDSEYVKGIARYGQYGKYDRHPIVNVKNKLIRKYKLPFGTGLVLRYKRVWKNMIKEKPEKNIQTYPGAVVKYDETPRKGKNGVYIKGATPELFGKFMKKQIERAEEVYKSDFIFLDAWNEWGEGNYLEPDTEDGYRYLEELAGAVMRGDTNGN